VADVKSEVLKEIVEQREKSYSPRIGPLARVRKDYIKPLYDRFGSYVCWRIWEKVQNLACYGVGARYVRDLTPAKHEAAAKIAEQILQIILEERLGETNGD